jgi:hypothetical protein
MGVITCYFLVTATNTFKMSDPKMGKQIFLKVGKSLIRKFSGSLPQLAIRKFFMRQVGNTAKKGKPTFSQSSSKSNRYFKNFFSMNFYQSFEPTYL